MKKIIAVILSLTMLLCAVSAMAEDVQAVSEKTTIGTVSINGVFTLQCGLPEGYYPMPTSVSQEGVYAAIRSEDPEAPVMYLSVAFDEQYYDVERLNDLGEEDLALLENTFVEDDPDVEITYGETGYGTLLLIARHETDTGDYIAFFSIYKGYCVHFVLAPAETAEDKNLTEDQLRLSIQFLTDLDFIPGYVSVNGQKTVAGETFLTDLTDYDAAANTVKATVKRPITLDSEYADSLQVGDTLIIGDEEIAVESLEKDEYGIIINDSISLWFTEDNEVTARYENDHEFTEVIAELTLQIPENLVFMDEIDPATGEILEEPAEHTAAEFTEMLAAGGVPDFASENVYVTFDDNGEMTLVRRVYTPWQ